MKNKIKLNLLLLLLSAFTLGAVESVGEVQTRAPRASHEKCDKKVKGDLLVCGDTKVKGDLDVHGAISSDSCIDAEGLVLRENAQNPCDQNNALWVEEGQPSKLSFTDNNGTDFDVDVTPKDPIIGKWMSQFAGGPYGTGRTLIWEFYVGDSGELQLRWLAGTQNQIREWTVDDYLPWTYFPFENNAAVTKVAPNSYTFFGPYIPIDPGEAYYGNDLNVTILNQRLSLRIQDSNPDLLLLTSPDYTPANPTIIQGSQLLIRVSDEVLSKVLVLDPPNADTTNPQFIFNAFFDILQTQLVQLETVINPSDYPGYPAVQAKRDFMLHSPVVRETSIVDVWRTRTPIAYASTYPAIALPASTSLLMEEFVAFKGLRIYIEGFEGDYAVLNSVNAPNVDYKGVAYWKTSVMESNPGRDIRTVYTSSHYTGVDQKNIINIDVDTSSLPPYNPSVHGVATLRAEAGPVLANTEYYDLTGAVKELYSTFGYMTHARAAVFLSTSNLPLQLLSTFEELQEAFDVLSLDLLSLSSRYIWNGHTTDLYLNPSLKNLSTSGTLPANEPLGMSQNDAQWYNGDGSNFSIVRQNYLDPEKTFTMYWAVDPNSAVNPNNITGQLTDYGYKNNGSQFLFRVENYSDPNPDSTLYDYDGGYKDHTVYGILKSSLTNGESIGYMFFDDTLFFDSFLGAFSSVPEMLKSGQVVAYQNQLNMLAVALQKLLEYNPSKIILDIRGNFGGFDITALASFFGADRAGLQHVQTYADNSFRGIIPIEDLAANFQTVYNSLQPNISLANVRVTDTEQQFPNALFKDGKVVVLTDINSFSGGDIFPHYFTNPAVADTRMLGNNVESRIVGDIDGRLAGESSYDISIPTNKNQNTTFIGDPVEPLIAFCEAVQTYKRGEDSYEYYLANQQPITAPDNLLNGDISKTAWPDLGYTSPHPLAPLAGWTATGNVQESTDVTAVADVAQSLAGAYFFISSPTTDYAVWFNVSGSGVAPVVPGRTLVQVNLVTNDSADVVATQTATALENTGDFTILFPSGNVARVTNRTGGTVTAPSVQTSGFGLNVVVAGANNVVGQPNPLDHDTWRDSWLEVALAA